MKSRITGSAAGVLTLVLTLAASAGEIHQAVQANNLARVKALLEKNSQLISSLDNYKQTPLHLAVSGNRTAIATYLLSRNASVNFKTRYNYAPLHYATMNGNDTWIAAVLARKADEIAATAGRILPSLTAYFGDAATVEIAPCQSQIGSGSLPAERLPSQALVIRPVGGKRAGAALNRIADSFRALPVPVIGRLPDDAFWLDQRCLEADDEAAFMAQLFGGVKANKAEDSLGYVQSSTSVS